MGNIYKSEKEVKDISRELASTLNTILRCHVEKKMLPYKLENIKSDFLYACAYFALAHKDTVTMINKPSSTYRTQEIIYYLGYAYFRISYITQNGWKIPEDIDPETY